MLSGSVRLAWIAALCGFCSSCDSDAGARHRRKYRHFQHHLCDFVEAVAVPAARRTRAYLRNRGCTGELSYVGLTSSIGRLRIIASTILPTTAGART